MKWRCNVNTLKSSFKFGFFNPFIFFCTSNVACASAPRVLGRLFVLRCFVTRFPLKLFQQSAVQLLLCYVRASEWWQSSKNVKESPNDVARVNIIWAAWTAPGMDSWIQVLARLLVRVRKRGRLRITWPLVVINVTEAYLLQTNRKVRKTWREIFRDIATYQREKRYVCSWLVINSRSWLFFITCLFNLLDIKSTYF